MSDKFGFMQYTGVVSRDIETVTDIYDAISRTMTRHYQCEVMLYGVHCQDELLFDECRRMTGDLVYGE